MSKFQFNCEITPHKTQHTCFVKYFFNLESWDATTISLYTRSSVILPTRFGFHDMDAHRILAFVNEKRRQMVTIRIDEFDRRSLIDCERSISLGVELFIAFPGDSLSHTLSLTQYAIIFECFWIWEKYTTTEKPQTVSVPTWLASEKYKNTLTHCSKTMPLQSPVWRVMRITNTVPFRKVYTYRMDLYFTYSGFHGR